MAAVGASRVDKILQSFLLAPRSQAPRPAPHEAIRAVAAGDLFFGKMGEGTAICVALSVSAEAILARDVCRRHELRFDSASGLAPSGHGDGFVYTITSTQRLPPDHHMVLVNYDRRQAAGEDAKLSDAEQDALVFVYDHLGAAGSA